MLRYLIHWVMCLGFILGYKVGDLSASEWTCVGSDTPNGMIEPFTQELFLTHDQITIKLESANPFLRLASEEVSIEGYSKACAESNASDIYDIAMQLLIIQDEMVACDQKNTLGIFLTSCAKDFAEYTTRMFQRDYVLLWQSYIFFMKVRCANDPLFISTAQKAFNLADAHEDDARGTFVVEFFLDNLTTQVGQFVAKKIINSELTGAQDPRFLQRVVLVFQSRYAPRLPAYKEAVQTLSQCLHQDSPPPYTEPE